MSYEFKRLSDTEMVATVGDSASILIEENGVIKRAPKDEVSGGVKVSSAAEVGQTIVVKAVDKNGNPTEWECVDRTCWEENGKVLILPETTWTFDATGYSGMQQVCDQLNLVVGEKYLVVWDGVEYNCVCFGYSGEAIGNFSAIGGPNNDEPFGIWSFGNVFVYETGMHTFSIYKDDAIIHKLDKKYLPDDVYTQADWNENDETSMAYIQNRPFYETVEDTILWDEKKVLCTTSGDYAYGQYDGAPELTWDIPVIVIFDGIEYENGSWKENGENEWILFNTSNGEAVRIYTWGNYPGRISVPASLAGEHTVKIIQRVSHLKQLDSKFVSLPASMKSGTGPNSLMIGNVAGASGDSSFAQGMGTNASGMASHAEGFCSNASECGAHAEGQYTSAQSLGSHAEGNNSIAKGHGSHAEGNGTTASHKGQHVEGEYNIIDPSTNNASARGTYVHIVGNGSASSARSNAHTLDWDGNAWYQGTVESTALILKSSTSGSTKRFKITVDDSGTIKATEITT